jgi:outer membrane protein OmpA-like peptidoglycan-associated protein
VHLHEPEVESLVFKSLNSAPSIAVAAAAVALLSTGCATKKFVRQTVDPVSGRVEEVSKNVDQTNQNLDKTNQNLATTNQTIEKDETELNATKERAMSADSRAGDALKRADGLDQKTDQTNRDLADLRGVINNLDDYKQMNQAVVNFKFNSAKLDDDAKSQLDQMVASQNQFKRYFITLEGFTDRVGSDDYNTALSKRRAEAVMEYLVSKHDVPVYRIHLVGLGKDKPVDEARDRAAQAKNRRVEVTLFSADNQKMVSSNAAQR